MVPIRSILAAKYGISHLTKLISLVFQQAENSLLKKCEKDSSFVVFVVFFRYTINGSIDLRTVCFLRRPFRISIVTQTSLLERKAQKGARNAVKTR
jgi:hypothetical protein